MIPFRVIRSGVLLAGLLAALSGPALATEGDFTATLSSEDKTAAGLTSLTATELTALDRLVADDIARARRLKTSALPGKLTARHDAATLQAAGLARLTPGQLAKLDALVDAAIYARPQPKERPRLKDGDVLSEQGRLRVHGGMSFTYGRAGGGRSFRETSAWVSYYDPVTGLGLGFGYSTGSGDGYYGYYPGEYGFYDRGYYPAAASYYSASPRMTFAGADRTSDSSAWRGGFRGDGESLRGPAQLSASGRGFDHR